jgi:hypothetical protein
MLLSNLFDCDALPSTTFIAVPRLIDWAGIRLQGEFDESSRHPNTALINSDDATTAYRNFGRPPVFRGLSCVATQPVDFLTRTGRLAEIRIE